MVQKKKLLDDLKSFNKELEDFLPKMDVDFFTNSSALDKSKYDVSDDEFISLFASNLSDLRTEVAIMRKHMTNDIENMVLKQIEESHSIFIKKVNDVNAKLIMDMRQTLSTHIKNLYDDVSEIRKEMSSFADYSKRVDVLLKKQDALRIEEKFDSMSKKIDEVGHDIAVKNKFLENNLVNFNKKLVEIENDLENTGNLVEEKSQNLSNLKNKLERGDYIKVLEQKIEKEDSLKIFPANLEVDDHILPYDKRASVTVQKIMDIDKKLEKLNSLR